MWSILGYFILVIEVQKTYSQITDIKVYGNTKFNLTFTTVNTNLVWERDSVGVRNVFFDPNSNSCAGNPPIDNYDVYCTKDGSNVQYVLEIQNTSLHDKSVFTGNQRIVIQNFLSTDIKISAGDLTESRPKQVNYEVKCSTSEPKLRIELTVMSSTNQTEIDTKSVTVCTGNVPVQNTKTYNGTYYLYSSTLELLFPDVKLDNDILNIALNICMVIDDIIIDCITAPNFNYVNSGPPSTPPTPSASTSLQPTSSAQNPSTKVSSESSTSTTPTPTPKCEDLICVCDQICIIIICVCVGSLIIIVVIILCCCCCPFCLCYKRRKKKSEGTECKCCGLICVCCRPNNKDHDEESEGRAKVCESCCCLFCVCYKRKKKSGDRNSNPNKKKSASRSQQYEMPRTNHPDGMHSYSGYQVNRPDERARVNQPADINYHVRRPDQQARVYQPALATGFTPHDSRYGQGYNNAAYMHHGENERRNMDRKSRVTQRPYTKHY